MNVSSSENLQLLNARNNQLNSLILGNNTQLTSLELRVNQLTSINLSSTNNLTYLNADENPIAEIDLSNCTSITSLSLQYSQLSNIDLSNCEDLSNLLISNCNLTTLDLSYNTNLNIISCFNNQLETIFLKNGNSDFPDFSGNPNLSYICVDDEIEYDNVNILLSAFGYNDVVVNTYCSFTFGGDYKVVQGNSKLDLDENGCNNNDSFYPSLFFDIAYAGVQESFTPSDINGNYFMTFPDFAFNDITITPFVENPDYYSVTPEVLSVNFDNDSNPYIQDFCITPNGSFNDLEVFMFALEDPRPGFDVDYKVIYKNKGTTTLNGTVDLSFLDDVMNFMFSNPSLASQESNQLSWSFSNLLPLETREITLTMNLNAPTDQDFPLNGGDDLDFTTLINLDTTDETPDDNTFTLYQTVVNSFDPNDKTCLEGDFIRESSVGNYLHYMIRFENTGTANAINVVIKDEIDLNKYDISTLIPLNASHDFVTRIQNTNEVEFIFENIDLPFDDANNDGYVVFKIETLETLTVGDTFSNDAEIYFDFNFPIITNDYVTTVEDNLSLEDQELIASAKLYPNPVNDKLYISSEVNIEKASIYDINGRLLQSIVFYGNETQRTIDLQKLALGVYVIKLSSENGELTQKFIKE